MNKELLSQIMNDYEDLAYNEIMNDLKIAIKEAKEKKLNPLETYKYIFSKLEELENELTNLFAISTSTPLSEDVLTRIDNFIDPYATDAMKYVKKEIHKTVGNMNDEDILDLYEKINSPKTKRLSD